MLSLAAISLVASTPITVLTGIPAGHDGAEILGGGPGVQVGLVYKYQNDASSAAIWRGDISQPTVLPLGEWGSAQLFAADGPRVAGRALKDPDASFPMPWHALVWDGPDQPPQDLTPAGFFSAEVKAMAAEQLGGIATQTKNGPHHPMLWKLMPTGTETIDLLPAGMESGSVLAVFGGVQAGAVHTTKGAIAHAAMWSGSAATFQDRNPKGYQGSALCGMSADQMVGWGLKKGAAISPGDTFTKAHALLWKGKKVIDLNPQGALHSVAVETDGVIQIGVFGKSKDAAEERACMWKGSAKSFVDLHALLPAGFISSRPCAIDGKTISGYAHRSDSDAGEAVIWRLP